VNTPTKIAVNYSTNSVKAHGKFCSAVRLLCWRDLLEIFSENGRHNYKNIHVLRTKKK
jgi:hypothetical protein